VLVNVQFAVGSQVEKAAGGIVRPRSECIAVGEEPVAVSSVRGRSDVAEGGN
jgi:hypothetical protein